MEVKEQFEHAVALKVMRLTRPTLVTPPIITCDMRDIPRRIFNQDLEQNVITVCGSETLQVGQFLLLPQSFGNIYLGETFSCYICVHNCTNELVTGVHLKANLQITSQSIHILPSPNQELPSSLGPNDTLDSVIHYEVKEIGTHILVCEVNYNSTKNTQESFRKFFKFQVVKPLDIKTKFYNADSNEVYLEATIQNITSGVVCLEKVLLESSDMFNVNELNAVDETRTVLDETNYLSSQCSCNLLYCLTTKEALSDATNIGKLDIVWRSNLGEKGRLQTSQLYRIAPKYGDINVSIKNIPSTVCIEETFDVICEISNISQRPVEILLRLRPIENSGLHWIGVSDRKLGTLEGGKSLECVLTAFPTRSGLLSVSGIHLIDTFLMRTYEYNELGQIFVMNI
ncbi:trafficking protein particle complex subunit 13 [Ctenocephalides felis]|uniref:trafficking protein particle complex subunit 13 n=1 Tax=Ctenocephalides felis TaxID=7515 RepID=UPI000E6E2C2C|nr:trafficking protein particle complex subunit 13 [Ctenocephalides felis]